MLRLPDSSSCCPAPLPSFRPSPPNFAPERQRRHQGLRCPRLHREPGPRFSRLRPQARHPDRAARDPVAHAPPEVRVSPLLRRRNQKRHPLLVFFWALCCNRPRALLIFAAAAAVLLPTAAAVRSDTQPQQPSGRARRDGLVRRLLCEALALLVRLGLLFLRPVFGVQHHAVGGAADGGPGEWPRASSAGDRRAILSLPSISESPCMHTLPCLPHLTSLTPPALANAQSLPLGRLLPAPLLGLPRPGQPLPHGRGRLLLGRGERVQHGLPRGVGGRVPAWVQGSHRQQEGLRRGPRIEPLVYSKRRRGGISKRGITLPRDAFSWSPPT